MSYLVITFNGIETQFSSIKDVYKYGKVFDIRTIYKDNNGERIDITAEYNDNLI